MLFSAAVVALHKEVTLPVPDEVAFLDNLLQWISAHAENALQREALIHLIAAVVNRHAESLLILSHLFQERFTDEVIELDTFLASNVDTFWSSQIADSSISPDSRKNAILVFKWVSSRS